MSTPTVDLRQTSTLADIILRGGDARQSDARRILQRAYVRLDAQYPDAPGISTLFRPSATLDDLAREGQFPNSRLSWSIVGEVTRELAAVGYELVLFITPTSELPDHHALAVARGGQVQAMLADDAADALLRAMRVVDNPYQQPKP